MISVTIVTLAHPGMGDELEQAWVFAARQAVEKDPGCRAIHISRSLDNPDRILAFEIYGSADELAAHNQSALSQELRPILERLVCAPPEIHVATLIV